MIKQFIIYSITFFLLYYIGLSIHENTIENQAITLPFSLKKVYLFHLAFSLLICINFLVLSNVDKIFEQLGFIYLGTIVLKLLVFCITFYKSIFTEESLSFTARLSLLIPMVLFLLTEAFFVAKILKKNQ